MHDEIDWTREHVLKSVQIIFEHTGNSLDGFKRFYSRSLGLNAFKLKDKDIFETFF